MHRTTILASLICLFLVAWGNSQDFLDTPAETESFDEFPSPGDSFDSAVNEDGSIVGQIFCIDEVDLAMSESGTLLQAPQEGDVVSAGDVVAMTDVTDAKARRMVAFYAWKAVERENESRVRLKYAEKNMEVAKASYEDAVAANRRTKNAVSEFEVRRRKFEWEAGILNIENTQHEMAVSKVSLQEKKAEYDAATLMMRHHEVRAPVSGIVEEKYLGKGSFVRPGDPICHIVRLDRMRVEYQVPINLIPPSQLKGRGVSVTVNVGAENGRPIQETFNGQIGFVSSTVALNQAVRAWAEFENRGDAERGFVVRKGMKATVRFAN
jgi:multidrug efflux pump subunit AcrA (membrane-fusion protein)